MPAQRRQQGVDAVARVPEDAGHAPVGQSFDESVCHGGGHSLSQGRPAHDRGVGSTGMRPLHRGHAARHSHARQAVAVQSWLNVFHQRPSRSTHSELTYIASGSPPPAGS
nr:hypothetical protein GCM10025730_19730 [Promicromonospora thailandica]